MPQLSLHTPLGPLTLSEENGCILALDWGWGRDQTETPVLRRGRDQLQAYFDGELQQFDLPLVFEGSAYRQRVWQALTLIPYGETRTYLQVAAMAGGSPRAVGGANGANRLPILVPCHRVVAVGHIGGYSGGDGIATKRFLLALESSTRGIQPMLDLKHVWPPRDHPSGQSVADDDDRAADPIAAGAGEAPATGTPG